MKIKSLRTSTMLLVASALLLALLGAGCKTVEREEPLSAWAMRLKGAARCSKDQRDWRAVQVGDKFSEPGWTIQTAEDSLVDLSFTENYPRLPIPTQTRYTLHQMSDEPRTIIRLHSDSTMVFNLMNKRSKPRRIGPGVKSISVNLVTGRVFVQARQFTPGSTLEISTSNSIVRVQTNEHKAWDSVFSFAEPGVIQVVLGTLEYEQSEPQRRVLVTAGNTFDARTGLVSPLEATAGPTDCTFPGTATGHSIFFPSDEFTLPARVY